MYVASPLLHFYNYYPSQNIKKISYIVEKKSIKNRKVSLIYISTFNIHEWFVLIGKNSFFVKFPKPLKFMVRVNN